MLDLPVADPWFVVRRVDDAITLVTEPHVHPLLRCNVWHVQGRSCDVVIDTALGLAPLRHLVDTRADGELLAIATHGHSDHIGGFAEFDRRAAHVAEAERIGTDGITSVETAHFPETVIGPYRDAGYDITPLMIDAVPPGGVTATVLAVRAAPVTRPLVEGDVIDLGDHAYEVLHLPGHSPGSIGLWDTSSGTLFSGDAIYDGPLLDELDGSDVAAYIATMQRLRALPVTVVHAGHEPSFGRERLVELCDTYLRQRGA